MVRGRGGLMRKAERRWIGGYYNVICRGMMRSAHTSVCHFNWSSSSSASEGQACFTFYCRSLRSNINVTERKEDGE